MAHCIYLALHPLSSFKREGLLWVLAIFVNREVVYVCIYIIIVIIRRLLQQWQQLQNTQHRQIFIVTMIITININNIRYSTTMDIQNTKTQS